MENQVCLKKQGIDQVYVFFQETRKEHVAKGMHMLAATIEDALATYEKAKDDQTMYRKCIYVDDTYVGDVWCHQLFCNEDVDGLLSLCIFDETYWSKGIASIVLTQFLKQLKEQFHVHKVGAYLYASNIGSKRVCEKHGFSLVKEFCEHHSSVYYFEKVL